MTNTHDGYKTATSITFFSLMLLEFTKLSAGPVAKSVNSAQR